ncbi:MAG TPA: hypothetical protein VFQ23_20300 [Anaerolineales bacterium]|nr:hypothetical protein [Anaerolineales bacterium]
MESVSARMEIRVGVTDGGTRVTGTIAAVEVGRADGCIDVGAGAPGVDIISTEKVQAFRNIIATVKLQINLKNRRFFNEGVECSGCVMQDSHL